MKFSSLEHDGWLGEPFASDFGAAWGIILLEDIYDGTSYPTLLAASQAARERGMRFFSYAVKGNLKLYREMGNRAFDVYSYLRRREAANDLASFRYATDPLVRSLALAQSARWREENLEHHRAQQKEYQKERITTPEQRASKRAYMRSYMPEYYDRHPDRLEMKREANRLYSRKKRAQLKQQKQQLQDLPQKEGE